MQLRPLKRIRDEQSGVTMIEVMVAAMVLLIASAGLYMSLTAGNRATALERHRVKANDLAEQELERVRSLRIADLSTWNSTRRVMEDGTELASGASCPATGQTCYSISSKTQFLTETASTNTCASGTGSRDYLQLSVLGQLDRDRHAHAGDGRNRHLPAERVARPQLRVAPRSDRRCE